MRVVDGMGDAGGSRSGWRLADGWFVCIFLWIRERDWVNRTSDTVFVCEMEIFGSACLFFC
jgi:hypothetical protein